MDQAEGEGDRSRRAFGLEQHPEAFRDDRAFSTPWPPVALIVVMVAVFVMERMTDKAGIEARFDFRVELPPTEWWRAVSSIFLHGSWGHLLLNCGCILAFGAQVTRTMGTRFRGVVAFYLYFIVCAVGATAVWALVHDNIFGSVLGASGGASALMGGTARLREVDGDVAPVFSKDVTAIAGPWLIINAAIGLVDLGLVPFVPPTNIAWQSHIAGLVIGLFALPIFLKMSGFKPPVAS